MTRIAPVKLRYNYKTLWFDALDFEIEKGRAVVVTTSRGVELGYTVDDIFEATEEQLSVLKGELKPVKRFANEKDISQADLMDAKGREALPVFKQFVAESSLEMRPISVEYLLEGNKAVFYFEAAERVDFRDLVRKLAAHFHIRVDMRQIGVRDEARMVGGLGHCGQELCCKRLGGEFCPVSIRMAKEQDLSLNPQKISGVCGRLMCCLRYEFDAYKDFKSRAPKQGASIQTPEGTAEVVGLDALREVVSLKKDDKKTVKIPLSDMEKPDAVAKRPTRISEVAWQRACAKSNTGRQEDSALFASRRMHEDASPGDAKGHIGEGTSDVNDAPLSDASSATVSAKSRKRRRSTTMTSHESKASDSSKGVSEKKQRRRSRHSHQQDASASREKLGREASKKKPSRRADTSTGASRTNKFRPQTKGGPKPGQRASGLRAHREIPALGSDDGGRGSASRVSRRRSHKTDTSERDVGGLDNR